MLFVLDYSHLHPINRNTVEDQTHYQRYLLILSLLCLKVYYFLLSTSGQQAFSTHDCSSHRNKQADSLAL